MTNMLYARHISTSLVGCVLRLLFYRKGIQAWGVTHSEIRGQEVAEPKLAQGHSICRPFSHSLSHESALVGCQESNWFHN